MITSVSPIDSETMRPICLSANDEKVPPPHAYSLVGDPPQEKTILNQPIR